MIAGALIAALLALPAQDAPSAQGAPAPAPPPAAAPAQAADTHAPAGAAPGAAATGATGLAPGEAARIDDVISISDVDLDRYLGTIYARLPEGDDVLKQLVDEALIEHDATAHGITVTDADIDARQAALDSQARAATGGDKGLAQSLGDNITPEALRHAMQLLVMHERLVRTDGSLPPDAPVTGKQMQDWLDARRTTAAMTPAGLDDALAATFDVGSITKAEVGARLRTVLKPDDLAGVLTEMIGEQLVQRRAGALGIDLTPAAATQEILDRDAALRSRVGVGDVTYKQYVEAVQKRSLAELLHSEKFATEVLIRLIVAKDWSEERAKAFWEKNRAVYAKTLGDGEWDSVRGGVWRDLRQRAYRQLFEESKIVRRF